MQANDGNTAYLAARQDVAVVQAEDAGVLRLTGRDRLDFLQRLSTNDLRGLEPGQGRPTVLTNPLGRVLAFLFAYSDADAVLLRTERAHASAVARYLDSMIFFQDDVRVADESADRAVFDLYGPAVGDLLARLAGREDGHGLPSEDYGWAAARVAEVPVSLYRGGPLQAPAWSISAARAEAAPVWAALAAAAPTLDPQTCETLRVEAGIPAWGRELSDQVTPLETGLQAAISYNKGCYTGQEVIARQTNYDKITRHLAGLFLPDEATAELSGAPVGAGGGRPGFVGSVAWSPALGRTIALAVLPRDLTRPGTEVTVQAAGGPVIATVAPLPFLR